MPLAYSVERFSDNLKALEQLAPRHWEELARDREHIPLDVDWERYTAIEKSGNLVTIVARSNSETVVGYVIALVSNHLHYKSTKFAYIDLFWLDPAHRKAMNGVRLFMALEKELARLGVVKMVGPTKLGKSDMGAVYRFLNWQPQEMIYAKLLKG